MNKVIRTTNGYAHWCPACEKMHIFTVDNPQPNGARWVFDGNLESPTFQPSMRVSWGRQADPSCGVNGGVCHYILTNGQIAFCGDCTHPLAGKTVPIPDLPEHLQHADSY